MANLILVRHGQSQWNLENRFTGWYDAELTEQGKEEAKKSGQLIHQLNINFEQAFTSFQKRASNTLAIILEEINQKKLITTNKDIKNYDFYNSNNIHVIDDVKNISIPLSFFETNYEEIPTELVEKYIVKNWVTTILAQ